MRKGILNLSGASIIMSVVLSMTSLAGQWVQDENGWRYQEYDGTFIHTEMLEELECVPDENGGTVGFISKKVEPKSFSSYYIDGNGDGLAEIYHFDLNGYLVTNRTMQITPDRSITVNNDGAELDENGKVVTIAVPQGNISGDIGKGIIKQEYINILMNGLDVVDAHLGTGIGGRFYSNRLHVSNFTPFNSASVNLLSNKVVGITGYPEDLFINPDITVSEISIALGIPAEIDVWSNVLFGGYNYENSWTLQENPKVVMKMRDNSLINITVE